MQAAPVRFKMLLDQLVGSVDHEQFVRFLNSCGWTFEDYRRGCLLREDSGTTLMGRWPLGCQDQDRSLLGQFLRLAETRSLAYHMLVQQALQQAAALHDVTATTPNYPFHQAISSTRPIVTAEARLPTATFRGAPATHLALLGGALTSSIAHRSEAMGAALNKSVTTNANKAESPISSNSDRAAVKTSHTTIGTGRDHRTADRRHRDDVIRIGTTSDMRRTTVGICPTLGAAAVRRPWQSTPGYGGTLVSATGKKRVLCSACRKTFCDKGALKIHYSAVHLKEMHRCTVDGCTMTFSSRRSRNRHSANPNSKLHVDHRRSTVAFRMSSQHGPARRAGDVSSGVERSSSVGAESTATPFCVGNNPFSDRFTELTGSELVTRPTAVGVSRSSSSLPWISYELSRLNSFRNGSSIAADGPGDLSLFESSDSSGSMTLTDDVCQRESVKCSGGNDVIVRRRKSVFPSRHCSAFDMGGESNDEEDMKRSSEKKTADEYELGQRQPGDGGASTTQFTSNIGVCNSLSSSLQEQWPHFGGRFDEDDRKPMMDEENHQEFINDYDREKTPSDNELCFDDDTDVIEDHVSGSGAMFSSRHDSERRKLLSTMTRDRTAPAQDLLTSSLPGVGKSSPKIVTGQPSKQSTPPLSSPSSREDAPTSIAEMYYYLINYNNSQMRIDHRAPPGGAINTGEMFKSEKSLTVDVETPSASGITVDTDTTTSTTCSGEQTSMANDVMMAPRPSPDGTAVCHVCKQTFHDNLVLKEHLEKIHPREMFRCTVPGCDKIFSTRKSRNRHSQNDNLHYVHPFATVHASVFQ